MHIWRITVPWPQRELKNPVIPLTESKRKRERESAIAHLITRAPERGEKCAMQRIVRCTCTRARGEYVSRVPPSPPGAKESHIHEIYSGIALLEHLRTMTMHPDALLPARRAIRVMHRNAPSDDCPLILSFSRNFFSHCYANKDKVLIARSDWLYFKF